MLEPTAAARLQIGVPVWGVALAVAVVAPWCVRFAVGELERRSRERTRDLLERARKKEDSVEGDG
jgi:hypothetical protein